ncbi:MAG: D-alanyl-D-alanine carboxypeptidase/D-alanyl-D-alanine-endopeptidase [Pyrinomonadaceae bacterium]
MKTMKLMINRNSNLTMLVLALISFGLTGLLAAEPASGQITTQPPPPTPTVSPSPIIAAPVSGLRVQTLSDLQAKLRMLIARPQVRRGQVGVKIVSLSTGKVVFDENSEKYFMPASNMKNFTVATALEKLTPDFRFVTSVYAAAMPGADGTIRGDLRIYGRGDVSISSGFSDGDPFKGLDDIASRIASAGVKRIEGSIVADDSYFKGYPIPEGWEWDDLQGYYGTEVSALPLNDNAVDLSVRPGPVGYSCTVKLLPYNPVYRVKNLCTTTAGSPSTLKIVKALGQNFVEITGTLPTGSNGFNGPISVSRPAELFAALLKQRLELKGIMVAGQYRTYSIPASGAPVEIVEIAKIESPPLSLIAAKTMKPSQNMYTETLLWALGEEARRVTMQTTTPIAPIPRQDSSVIGIAEVKDFLSSIGVAPDGIDQRDGSGLSRHNLITPAAVVQLYLYMSKQSKYSQVWRDSLTIGGVDGTLRNRFKGTAAAGNIRGKTGTIDQVSALSGYITTAGGEQLVLSIVVNGVPIPRDRTALIDDIVLEAANFKGKID